MKFFTTSKKRSRKAMLAWKKKVMLAWKRKVMLARRKRIAEDYKRLRSYKRHDLTQYLSFWEERHNSKKGLLSKLIKKPFIYWKK